MPESKSQRSLTQIIKKNQVDDLTARVELLEEELKNKEILLINLEKLSSLGQFVREIVHELKNPLTAISGFTELGKLAKTKKDREEYLNKIPKFIHQITSRLSQFRAMTFNTGMKYDRVDLVQVLAECLSTLELLKPKGTDIESNFVSKDCNIMGDAEQWIQVFLGISRSYFNYMKEVKSSLKVKSETFSSAELKSISKEIDVCSIPVEDWINKIEQCSHWVKITFENRKITVPNEKINVAFNSCKKAENLDKIQELGLVIACDIVKRHQGIIYTKKSKSSGFSVHICVPKND
jgi:nitrogen-specific signal transduction histidine kinase